MLGKKSWNVYNQENIAKVRRDEAEAKLREEEEERRTQEVDSDQRLQLLRGEQPVPSRGEDHVDLADPHSVRREDGVSRKKRKLIGEDDTDRDLRLAREDAQARSTQYEMLKKPSNDVSILDRRGHITLLSEEHQPKQKNSEAKSEAAQKRRKFEDQYTMRFSNAAGLDQGLEDPWYAAGGAKVAPKDIAGKDVWGNEDPRRKQRERQRLDANDPMAAMKKGVKKLREAEQNRKEWKAQRERDLYEVEHMARGREKRKRRRSGSESSLEDFSLVDGYKASSKDKHRHREKHIKERGRRRTSVDPAGVNKT